MRRSGLVAIAVAASMIVACNRDGRQTADNARGGSTDEVGTVGWLDNAKVTRGDQDFVHDIAVANTAETELGKMAAERGTDAQVKKFGQMVVDDHLSAGEKLKAVASENAIEWPAELDDQHRNKRDELGKKRASDFDRDYIAYMIDAHQDVADKLESRIDKKSLAEWKADFDGLAGKKVRERGHAVAIAPENSDNPVTLRINEWAAAVYPVVYMHLESARSINRALKRHTD
jgi:putative membrane protein